MTALFEKSGFYLRLFKAMGTDHGGSHFPLALRLVANKAKMPAFTYADCSEIRSHSSSY